MKKTVSLVLCLALLVGLLAACAPKETAADPTPSEETTQTAEPTPSPSPEATDPTAPRTVVNLAVLSGPTGMGAAQLMAQNAAGNTKNDYRVTVETDNSAVSTKLINGEYDIAAVATNLASSLYHKTNGGVQLAAINTLGVLYILGRGIDETVSSLADLSGKTIVAFGQSANPEYVLDYLLTENGLDPDADVDIQWKASADEVTAAMLAGEADWCMLPVPAATALQVKSEGSIQPVFNLSQEWDALQNGSQLTMGCIVVRTEFAQENPQAVTDFLAEYQDSITYMTGDESSRHADDPSPAQLLADNGLLPSAAIAEKALPAANLVCITGTDMRDTIQGYYEVLFKADPKSIGGSIPDDAFYFLGE